MFRINKGRALSVLRNPATISLAVCLILLAVNIAFIGKLRPFNSDDLYWQQVVRTWRPFNGHTLYLGTKDIFVEQVPIFYFLEHFFSPGRKLLIAEAGMLMAGSFTLYYLSSLYFLTKLKVKKTYTTLLPFIWLASFGYPLVQNYLNSDWRGFEVGLSFVTFVLAAAYLLGDIHPFRNLWNKFAYLIALGFVGLMIYSDPYYVFFTVAPVVLFGVALFYFKKISLRKFVVILVSAAISELFAKIIFHIGTRAGVTIVTDVPAGFVSFDYVVTNIVTSLHGLLIVFNADFFGRPITKAMTIGAMINAAALVGLLIRTWNLKKIFKTPGMAKLTLPQLWTVFMGGMVIFVFLVYTSSSLVMLNNYRYFIMLIYCGITFLAMSFAVAPTQSHARTALIILLVAGTIFNMGSTLFTHTIRNQINAPDNIGNGLNLTIVKAVKSEDLTKGYASYWQANINTYLSGGKVTFLPSLCDPTGKTAPYKWLIDGYQFEQPASKTFYVVDPDIPEPAICSTDLLIKQFGQPAKVIKIEDKTILIFDYDISSKMSSFSAH